MAKTIIVIPALNPDERLIKYCRELLAAADLDIVLVDDGSDDEHRYLFDEISKLDRTVVLRHYINMGKGRALKDAFNYCLNTWGEEGAEGVITADSDGQHSVSDVLKLKEALAENKDRLILGVRDFNDKNVPPKSRFGNKTTKVVFALLHGVTLTDTQTGLRAMSLKLAKRFLAIYGERFEYETEMLVAASAEKIDILEIPIQTLYENQNQGTHFNPIKDSIAIYRVLLGTFLRYSFASFSSFIVDILIFQFAIMLMSASEEGAKIALATIAARVVSSIYNYLVNKKLVFGKKDGGAKTFAGYYCLVIVQMCLSAGLVYLLHSIIPMAETVIKIIVDTCLFMISYRIQKKYIFGK